MPTVSKLYFKTAIVFLVIGIMMGLQISISGNHNVIGAHAHTNLLGWVTMALFGTYFALVPEKAQSRLAKIQYGVYTTGVVVMTPSLYFMLMGNPAFEPLVAVSSLVGFAGVLLFAFLVFSGAGETASRSAAARS
jgi:cbb3-type cytochrome oxidase subunit 1